MPLLLANETDFVRLEKTHKSQIRDARFAMQDLRISLAKAERSNFSQRNHSIVYISDFLQSVDHAILGASLQKFAEITPQYPGVRAPLADSTCRSWLGQLTPLLNDTFGQSTAGWEMQAWYSIVTKSPEQLIPMQRLPHVDGTDPNQIALMLYLHKTEHGGTAFFRHKSTGLEALTDATYPRYAAALQQDVKTGGLPAAAYTSDGEPYFERTHVVAGEFNQAVLYRGNILHSGIIDNDAPLSSDPREGRLTINAFIRPIVAK